MKEEIVSNLSRLQDMFILQPVYTTVADHINVSKEGELTKCGKARILTNSLAFDMAKDAITEILKNINKGATYTYYMPKSENGINEIMRYIDVCMDVMPEIQRIPKQQQEIYERISFQLFDESIYCSYNFALFIQNATSENHCEYFKQGWWYINPGKNYGNLPGGVMIANEILNQFEIQSLERCFEMLAKEETTRSFTGQDVINNLSDFANFVRKDR